MSKLSSLLPKLILPEGGALVHERLAEALAAAIHDGRYKAGDRLPTHRELSRHAGVSIGSVTRAIDLLTRRGLVRGEVGRGTFVNALQASGASGLPIDLTINMPPPVIDEAVFADAMHDALSHALRIPLAGYADFRGTDAQRQVMADWLSADRLKVSADDILLTVGGQQAVHLAFADIKDRSPVILTEAATFSGAIVAAANLGVRFDTVDHDADGMRPDDLERAIRATGARAIYTVPVCQNPFGFEMSEARRRDILRVCERHDVMIVEDDIYGVYAFKQSATYKALAPERVYYLTSLSKCLTPLVRSGVLVPPPDRRAVLTQRIRAEVWGAAPVAIETGCALVRNGAADTARTRLRQEARARVQLSAEILGLREVAMPEGAPHIWLPMPALEAERLARRSAENGVRVTPPDSTFVKGDKAWGVRLCIMAPTQRQDVQQALKIVAELMRTPDEVSI
ncbi:PLP-dependent aminotransferase family protein [Asticcacaulis tiandongensis]|uniref:aminotransferase-like domain-containing protein n=1 Tax=Asticcacaulis tiandongensis TaxID=2565365 RepID=UPI00112D85D8|nr:PLP-dependent aminotransferase family protein [Asticcacaulis tiandongensis]